MDTYKVRQPLLCRLDSTMLQTTATLVMTDGDPTFTPLAVAWRLSVQMTMNGRLPHYMLVENTLHAFAGSAFCRSATAVSDREQTRLGFVACVAPGQLDTSSQHKRRYVKALAVNLDFLHAPQSNEMLFGQVLALADYAFASLWAALACVAPAVFTAEYARIETIRGTFVPLARALSLPSAAAVERAAEAALCRPGRRTPWSRAAQRFFAAAEYAEEDFVPLAPAGRPYTCVPVFVADEARPPGGSAVTNDKRRPGEPRGNEHGQLPCFEGRQHLWA